MSDTIDTVFGIDLGTTYSCIAYVDEYNRPTIVPNMAGDRTTPSVVQFAGEERIVGKEAKNSSMIYPENTVEMIKREMGKVGFRFEYEGQTVTPEEISSYILRKLVQDAEQYTGKTIRDVIITCPAYFGIPEREATANAGKIAGLNVMSIIDEPVAAAIAYGISSSDEDQVILVYDLGGGTFDVTIIEIKGGNIKVVCTDGDAFLGGRNWDETLVSYFAEQWQKETGSSEDPLESFETLQDFYLNAERAKQTLSAREKSDVGLVHSGNRARVTLTREKFDELTRPLVDRTILLIRQALDEAAKRGYGHFDQLLLVGGSTRMPQISERLREELGVEPKVFEPDESVAKGAAVYGQKLMLDEKIVIVAAKIANVAPEEVRMENISPQVLEEAQMQVAQESGLQIGQVKALNEKQITGVASQSFGVIAYDSSTDTEIVSNLIILNDPLPHKVSQQFGTMLDDQETADIRIVENRSGDKKYLPSMSKEIYLAILSLPPHLPAGSPIEITFELNEQGRLWAHARELSAGSVVEVELQTEKGSSPEEMVVAQKRSTAISIS